MNWTDEGIVLEVRRFGETAAVAGLFTRDHGRVAGLVHGGQGRRLRPLLQPGNEVACRWRARTAEHLGSFGLEPLAAHAAAVLHDPVRLDILGSLTALLAAALPEHDPHPRLYDGARILLGTLGGEGDWIALLIRFEVELLAELGFGLDLGACSATGAAGDLTHVSPRTGRAVSRAAAAPYAGRLLALPALLGGADRLGSRAELRAGLALTGHFLERHLLDPRGSQLPAARARLAGRLAERA